MRFVFLFVLLTVSTEGWTAEGTVVERPVLARLSFHVAPEQIAGFEAAYEAKLKPILDRYAMVEASEKGRATIDSVFSRLFVFRTPSEVLRQQEALEQDRAWSLALQKLGATVIRTTTGPSGWAEHRFGLTVYISPAVPSLVVKAGRGKGHWRTYDVGAKSMMLDRDGNIWFGVKGGAVRYDGAVWTHFTPAEGMDIVNPEDSVWSMLQDRDGNYWFGSLGRVSRYDGQTVTTFTRENGLPEQVRFVTSILQDRDGHMWFGGSFGAIRYGGQNFTHFTTEDGLAEGSVRSILQDKKGDIWFSSNSSGVSRYDGRTFSTLTTEDGLPDNRVWTVFQDREGNLWFSTLGSGVCRYDDDGKTFKIFTTKDGLADDLVYSIFQDREGNFWFGTKGGVSRYDGRMFRTFTTEGGLADNLVEYILQDREGSLWFGGRVDIVSRYDETFTSFTTEDGLPNHNIRSMFQDREGNFWFGTRGGGVVRYDGKTLATFTTEDGLVHNEVRSIFQARDGNLWFGTYGGGMTRYDGKSFTNFNREDGLADDRVYDIFQDRKGHLWLTTHEEMNRFDGRTFTSFEFGRSQEYTNYESLYRDREGTVWAGAGDGVHRFDGQDMQLFLSRDLMVPPAGRLELRDRDGNFWFGSYGYGAGRYDGKGFTHFTTKDGLALDFVRTILEDRQGHLWFGTGGSVVIGKGATRYDGRAFQTLSTQDGLVNNNVEVMLEDREGNIWFGTPKGITRYRQPAPQPPSVAIDAVVADRRYIDASEVSFPSSIRLVAFEFQGNSFKTRPEAMVYRYRLKGYEDWQTTKADRMEYTELPRGEYTFEVVAIDRDLVYSEVPATVVLSVHWPYERIGWSSALGIALMLIAWQGVQIVRRNRALKVSNQALSGANRDLFGVNQTLQDRTGELETARDAAETANRDLSEVNRVLEDQKEELGVARDAAESANRAKSHFLANMSHELRTPLNGILGYAQILKRDRALNRAQQDGVEIIQRGGEHLLTLITDLLDLARIEADRLDLEEGVFHLPTFLKDIGEMIGVRAERKGVTLVSEALSDLPEYVQGDERRLRQVLINLLGNAVKFTEEGEVFLKVTDLNGDQLRFEVLDTGVGISADKLKDIFKPFEQVGKRGKRIEGTGLGLAISHQLVGLMGGTLQVESKVGKGSRFWFSVALSEVEGSQEGVQKIEQTPVGFRGDVKKVLVVDDREENRLVLIDVLKPLGFEVDEACDGSEGLTKAEAWQPDLILMDLVMPEMDGFEAVGRIRQLDAFRDTTVFALSASVFEHDQKRSLEEGFDDFISKPVRVGELLGKMASHTALEWVYEERTPEVMANGEMQAPPPESLGSLFELAQKGRIVGVREEIDQIGGMGEEYEVFAEKLREMARGFKLREMCAFLESYLEETT